MSDGREERKEQEERRRWAEERSPKEGDRPYREREWEDRGREPS